MSKPYSTFQGGMGTGYNLRKRASRHECNAKLSGAYARQSQSAPSLKPTCGLPEGLRPPPPPVEM